MCEEGSGLRRCCVSGVDGTMGKRTHVGRDVIDLVCGAIIYAVSMILTTSPFPHPSRLVRSMYV